MNIWGVRIVILFITLFAASHAVHAQETYLRGEEAAEYLMRALGGSSEESKKPTKKPVVKKTKSPKEQLADNAFAKSKQAYDADQKEEGLKYLRQAAEAGHAEAQYIMGMKYLKGGQLPQDDQLSFEWTRKAAKQRHVGAAFQMFSKYIKGTGVEKDEREAHLYLRQSVRNGNTNASARFLLAQNYLYGWGTSKNPLLALNWMRLAASDGHANSQKTLDSILQNDAAKNLTFQDCETCPIMVILPKDSFLMGNYPDQNVDKKLQHVPLHFVNLPHTFAVGQTEITHTQWNACVKDKGCSRYIDKTPAMANNPIVYVNWREAQQYTVWLSQKTNKPYRLLTESEWEFAARSGMNTAYPSGTKLPDGRAHCKDCGSQWDDQSTAPVKSFAANGYGLFDMLGNAAEWTEDCAVTDYEGKPPMGIAWTLTDCKERVVRGGAWDTTVESLRVYDRFSASADRRKLNIGFRVAVTLEDFPKRIEAAKAHEKESEKALARTVGYSKPFCTSRKEIDGWKFFWQEDYFTIQPVIYDLGGTSRFVSSKYAKVKISKYTSGKYSVQFQYSAGAYSLVDIYQLLIDGVLVYEGKWTSTKSADGKSTRDSLKPLDSNVIPQMEAGKVAEIRVIERGFDRPDKIKASAKFSLTEFVKYHKNIQQWQTQTITDKKNGKCR